MSEIGDLNQAKIAAAKVNSAVPNGTILVNVAKAPTAAAGVSTASTATATAVAGATTGILHLVAPTLGAETLGAIGTILGLLLNFLFSWLRHRRENAKAPGVGTS